MHAHVRFAVVLAVPLCVVALPRHAHAERWIPVTAQELAIKTPRVDPNADAEVLMREIRAEDSFEGNGVVTDVTYYMKTIVFNERGKELVSRVDIPFDNDRRVSEIDARTTLPDGKVVVLESKDVFDRTVIKEGKRKVRVKSFVYPGVVPGSVVEARWHEKRFDSGGLNVGFDLQTEVPIRKFTIRIKPILLPDGPSLRFIYHNSLLPPLRRDPDGYHSATVENVPAFRNEPMMPPDVEVRSWMATYYTDSRQDPDRFWKDVGSQTFEKDRATVVTGKDLREAAVKICAGAANDDEKLQRLYDHCRREIRHLNDDALTLTPDERKEMEKSRNVRQTLERGAGTDWEIDVLFASLAASLGYDARMARMADGERSFFDRQALMPSLLNTYNVAVRVGDRWRFYDPAGASLPPGMLRWQEEGRDALIPDPKQPLFVATPRSPLAASCTRRIGVFKLGEDGSLDGLARIEYHGHTGVIEKEDLDELAAEGREEEIRTRVRRRLPTAELSGIHFTHLDTPDLPLVVEYGLHVPDFAQVTGKRVFFNPAVFEKGVSPMFSDERRAYPIDFHYAWSEYDSVLIELPAGFELDQAEAPPNHTIGDFGRYTVRMGVANGGRLIVYRREFEFGRTRFVREDYPALRADFQTLHERDAFQLAARKSDAGP